MAPAITGHTELQLHFTEEFELARHVKSLANSPFASKRLKKVLCLCDRDFQSECKVAAKAPAYCKSLRWISEKVWCAPGRITAHRHTFCKCNRNLPPPRAPSPTFTQTYYMHNIYFTFCTSSECLFVCCRIKPYFQFTFYYDTNFFASMLHFCFSAFAL